MAVVAVEAQRSTEPPTWSQVEKVGGVRIQFWLQSFEFKPAMTTCSVSRHI